MKSKSRTRIPASQTKMHAAVDESALTRGVERICAAQPVWTGLALAAERIAIPDRTVLHAGPPYQSLDRIPAPVRNSAAVAAVYEGWARDFESALEAIVAGKISFLPSRNFDVVVPLAAVVSPGMWLQIVEDQGAQGSTIYSPINAGMGYDLRFGLANPEILNDLHKINFQIAPQLRDMISTPIDLLPIADQALYMGDDCHGSCTHATRILHEQLKRSVCSSKAVSSFISNSQSFFLNLWISAARCMLSAAQGEEGCPLVTSMAANGDTFGIQLAAQPDIWHVTNSESPVLRGKSAGTCRPLRSVGDSPNVEAAGFGAMTWSDKERREHHPMNQAELAWCTQATASLTSPHRQFNHTVVCTGLNAAHIAKTGHVPVISLGVLDSQGANGLIGRGLYMPTLEVFLTALKSIEANLPVQTKHN